MESLTTTDAAPGKAVNGSQVSITPVAAALGPAEDNEPASSDSESEDQSLTSNQHDIKQQRRVQNAKFEDLYAPQRFHHVTAEDVKAALKSVPDAQLSTASLIAKQDFAATITDPREYQIELFERAKTQNTIAVLDTGAGKTLIAVLLLRHIIQQELVDRGMGYPHRISFFLVDSVTLVFQQAAVLRNNIDQKVAHLYGSMGTDMWSRQTWEELFSNNMVIVCTAEIVYQCLLNSHIKMNQINLLIFDEAHHTKKDHPYARIIKDSYLKEQPENRPRIFGMTASPIDTKGDIAKAAAMLETLLDSRIATTSNLTLLRQSVNRPNEEVWAYRPLQQPFETTLYKMLKSRFSDLSCLEKTFRYSLEASSELGSWCSDQVWKYALAEEVLPRLESKINKGVMNNYSHKKRARLENEKKRIKEACEIVKNHVFTNPDLSHQLSPKVRLLCDEISKYFELPTGTKCIIFVEKRHTARVLGDLLAAVGVTHLRPGILIGVRSGDDAGMKSTFRQQFMSLAKFRTGELNCLVATSVAEEGLDIPDCNLVVRFDLYRTLIQYVQSRGRARHTNSTYAHMVEENNLEHETLLEEVRHAEGLMRNFCETLPEDRILHGNGADMDSILEKEIGKRTYRIQNTGATLTYHSSLAILSRYASSLQYEKDISAQVTYIVLPSKDAYVCEVILPEKSPVRGLVGKPASRKSLAKQSAAFDTCCLLRKNGLLDDRFNSIYHKRLPAMRNAKLAITSKKTNQYDMLTKPSFWKKASGTIPETLYVTVIMMLPSKQLSRKHQSIAILTRERLPIFPRFPLYLEDDIETDIVTLPMRDALRIGDADLEHLTTFTLRVFRDVFHKTYEHETAATPYWIAPITSCHEDISVSEDPRSVIDWDILKVVQDNDDLPWSADAPAEYLLDRFVFDKWDGRYRYFTMAIEDGLRPSDPPPAFMPRRRHMGSIMDYTLSLFKNARARFLDTCTWDQPVVKAELVRLRRNLLEKMTEQERDIETRCFICLEALKISAIPVSVATTCLSFPAIISRLEAYLISLECCEDLGLAVETEYALEALTKDSDNTEEHRSEQIHFQRGMGKNYERLEFLGDCFLKMGTSISLFAQNPDDNEFDYHVNRMVLICNQNLFNTAKKSALYKYIRSRGFSRRTWYPDGLKLLQGKSHDKSETKHALGEKTIADVCEALIGASLLSGGPEHRFDMAVKAVTAFVDSATHNVSNWKEYMGLYSRPLYQVQEADGFEIDLAQQVEAKLGYHFNYPRLLRSAFTHPSMPSAWSNVPCYQRLEFLGDSLLDMACVEDLFARFPDRDPQWLTEHKMAVVSNKFLGAFAVSVGLHKHLKHFSGPLQSQITEYAEEVQTAQLEGGDAKDFWTVTKDPPKCLPDMVEAYLGAVFVDSDFNFEVVEAFYRQHIKPYFEDMSIYDTFANKHPTTHLHNRLTNDFGCLNYCLKAGEVPAADSSPTTVLAAVIVHDSVIAQGTASSSRYAKIKASEAALTRLEGLPPFRFRELYLCDCQRKEDVPIDQREVGTAI
ncbi:Dicer-like protein 1 [Paecilomyces lecythidis]